MTRFLVLFLIAIGWSIICIATGIYWFAFLAAPFYGLALLESLEFM